MNIGHFTGRLTKEIEIQKDEKGEDYAIITIANNDTKDKPVFITGKISGKQAQFAKEWIKPKGRVVVTFHLWQHTPEGNKYPVLRTAFSKIEAIDWMSKEDKGSADASGGYDEAF